MNDNYDYHFDGFYGDAFSGMEGLGPMLLGVFLVFLAIGIAVGIFSVICMWKLFTKAGQPGWKSLIPVYNTYIMILIGGNPGWWLILLFIPYVNIVITIMMIEAFVRAFGRVGIGPVLLMMFLGIFYMPYLAFSKEVQYIGIRQAYGWQYGSGNGSQYASGYGSQNGAQAQYGPQDFQQPVPRNIPQPGFQPGFQPGPQYGFQPGFQPGPQYGSQPGFQSGTQYGPQPGFQPGPQYGSQPGFQPGPQYGSQPGFQSGTQYGPQPGFQPGPQYGSQPVFQPGSQYGPQPGFQPGPQYGRQPGFQPGPQYGPQPGFQPGPQYGPQHGFQPGSQFGQQPGFQPGSQHDPQSGFHSVVQYGLQPDISYMSQDGRPPHSPADAPQDISPGNSMAQFQVDPLDGSGNDVRNAAQIEFHDGSRTQEDLQADPPPAGGMQPEQQNTSQVATIAGAQQPIEYLPSHSVDEPVAAKPGHDKA